jgi:hypothetical protein
MKFWWQAGVAKYICDNYDTSNLTIIGTSAGSLTATFMSSEVCFSTAAKYAKYIEQRDQIMKNPLGLAGIWGNLINEWYYILYS